MKAAVYEKRGSISTLVYQDVKKPLPKNREVLVKVHASSINALDYRMIQMGIGLKKGKIFGADIAGRVEAVGSGVLTLKPGDDVYGDISGCGLGGFAEYVAVPESVLAKKPSSVSFEDAAALPVAAVTALQALRDKGSIQSGQRVLIYGAGGGVGTYALQLAKYYSANVTAVCSAENAQAAYSLGADHVIDYAQEDLRKSGNRYNLIVAVNGKQPISAYRRALAPEGICVMVGGALSQIFKAMFVSAIVSLDGKKFRVLAAKPNAKDLHFIMGLVQAGRVKPVIDRRYSLSEAGEALQYLLKGHGKGKVVLSVLQKEQ